MYARSWIEGQQNSIAAVAAPAPQEEVYEVLVADADLPAGTFVKPQHLRWQRWPTDDVPETYVLKGARGEDEMVGAVVRRGIAEGEPITDGGVVKPGERGFLAAVLEPGMRAVSLPINATSSNSGPDLSGRPGRSDPDPDPGGRRGRDQPPGQRDRAARHPHHRHGRRDQRRRRRGQEPTRRPRPPRSRSRRAQAEKVALLTELGKLSLSLRSLADDATPRSAPVAEDEQPTPGICDVSRVLRSDQRLSPACSCCAAAMPKTFSSSRDPTDESPIRFAAGAGASPRAPGRASPAAPGLTLLLGLLASARPRPGQRPRRSRTDGTLTLEVRKGQVIRLPRPAATVFVADPEIADVQAQSPSIVYLFGRRAGSTSLYAVDENDQLLLRTQVVVEHNLSGLRQAIDQLLPGSRVTRQHGRRQHRPRRQGR